MSTITAAESFLGKHHDKLFGVLSCFDRLIFRGYLPLSYPRGLEGFLNRQQVLFKDFKHYAPQIAERIKSHVKGLVEKAGGLFRHLPRKIRMEEEARRIAQAKNLREGIVCGFAQLETCRTFRLEYGAGRPRLRKDFRRCTVVYVNGHDFLSRKLDNLGVTYTRHDNAFTHVSNLAAAQKCADRLAKQNWPKLLGALARQFNPLLGQELQGQDYYWVTDQAEYATDVLFVSPAALASLYPRLREHATLCLSAEDVLRFLGRKLHPSFVGEVQTHTTRRLEGTRVKHSMKSNRLKMYDKAGSVLRIETVINDPTEFWVRRPQTTKSGERQQQWQPLRKGVAWLWRYAEVSRTANSRYLAALSVVDDDSAARRLLDRVTRPAKLHGRRKRALQPLNPAEQQLFLAALRGEHRLQGFRNQDIAQRLYPQGTRDAGARRRRCARVTRLIQLLRAHRLVSKVPRSRRYKITAAGERFMSAAIVIRQSLLPKTIHEAA